MGTRTKVKARQVVTSNEKNREIHAIRGKVSVENMPHPGRRDGDSIDRLVTRHCMQLSPNAPEIEMTSRRVERNQQRTDTKKKKKSGRTWSVDQRVALGEPPEKLGNTHRMGRATVGLRAVGALSGWVGNFQFPLNFFVFFFD